MQPTGHWRPVPTADDGPQLETLGKKSSLSVMCCGRGAGQGVWPPPPSAQHPVPGAADLTFLFVWLLLLSHGILFSYFANYGSLGKIIKTWLKFLFNVFIGKRHREEAVWLERSFGRRGLALCAQGEPRAALRGGQESRRVSNQRPHRRVRSAAVRARVGFAKSSSAE